MGRFQSAKNFIQPRKLIQQNTISYCFIFSSLEDFSKIQLKLDYLTFLGSNVMVELLLNYSKFGVLYTLLVNIHVPFNRKEMKYVRVLLPERICIRQPLVGLSSCFQCSERGRCMAVPRNKYKYIIYFFRAGEPEPVGAGCFWLLGAGAA